MSVCGLSLFAVLQRDHPPKSSQFSLTRPTKGDSNWWLGPRWHNHLSTRLNIVHLYPNCTAISVAIASHRCPVYSMAASAPDRIPGGPPARVGAGRTEWPPSERPETVAPEESRLSPRPHRYTCGRTATPWQTPRPEAFGFSPGLVSEVASCCGRLLQSVASRK